MGYGRLTGLLCRLWKRAGGLGRSSRWTPSRSAFGHAEAAWKQRCHTGGSNGQVRILRVAEVLSSLNYLLALASDSLWLGLASVSPQAPPDCLLIAL